MIASLCEAYHWSYHDALRLTLPQIIMLNHAASVNYERYDRQRDRDGDSKSRQKARDAEMSTDELQAMFGELGGFNVVSQTET